MARDLAETDQGLQDPRSLARSLSQGGLYRLTVMVLKGCEFSHSWQRQRVLPSLVHTRIGEEYNVLVSERLAAP